MVNLSPWLRFLTGMAKRPPLRYVHGMRHTVTHGDCCGAHLHSSFEIVYHPTGRGVTVLGGIIQPFQEGSVVINAPNELHNQSVERDGEDFCVQVEPPADGAVLKAGIYIPRIDSSSVREDLHLLSVGYPGLTESEQTIFNLRATALLLELIQIACTRRNQDNANSAEQYVLKAEQFIREQFQKLNSLSEVAAYVGVSHDHLRHIFKTLRGKTLIRHLNEVRTERARTLLRNSHLPIKQIATMSGFRDEYYFSAVFRQFTQVTPGYYRQMSEADRSNEMR